MMRRSGRPKLQRDLSLFVEKTDQQRNPDPTGPPLGRTPHRGEAPASRGRGGSTGEDSLKGDGWKPPRQTKADGGARGWESPQALPSYQLSLGPA
jgi:hypothetical protein